MNPKTPKSNRAVMSDRWDRERLRMVCDDLHPFQQARDRLGDFTPTGQDALDDVFLALTKAAPRLHSRSELAPTHYVNHAVAGEMADLSAVRRLRLSTVGDPIQAAMACADLEPKLETVFDRLQLAQSLAEQLTAMLQAMVMAATELSDAEDMFDNAMPGTEEMAEARERLQQARAALGALERQVGELESELSSELESRAARIRLDLQEALSEAAVQAALFEQTAKAWGTERGMLMRLSPEQRLELARRLKSQRLQEIAALYGRLANLSFSLAAERTPDVHDETVDLKLGGNLDRVIPAEFLLLADPATEAEFLARWCDRELLEYAVEGTDEQGRGGIIFCCDGSYSMHGAREIFAKAVMLVLLHEARRSNRQMHVVHFGAADELQHLAFTGPSDFTPERILEAAELFHGGGTDYETPMDYALGLLRAEHEETGRTRADVVFASDDECWVEEQFMANYLAEMDRMGSRTWSLCFGVPMEDGPMEQMAPGRLMTVEDLTAGTDITGLLAGIQ